MARNSNSPRYRTVSPSFFWDSGARGLNRDEMLAALYLLTSPQTNRIGLYPLSIAMAAEQLHMTIDEFVECLRKVCESLHWQHDPQSTLLYIPTWWKWHHPENPSVMAGNLKDLVELHRSDLLHRFCQNTRYLSGPVLERFREVVRDLFPDSPQAQPGPPEDTEAEPPGSDPDPQGDRPAEPEEESGPAQAPQPDQPAASHATPKAKREEVTIPKNLQTPTFAQAWEDWKKYRREIRKTLKPTTERIQLEDLSRWGPDIAELSIRQSMKNGWMGLFIAQEDGRTREGQDSMRQTSPNRPTVAEADIAFALEPFAHDLPGFSREIQTALTRLGLTPDQAQDVYQAGVSEKDNPSQFRDRAARTLRA